MLLTFALYLGLGLPLIGCHTQAPPPPPPAPAPAVVPAEPPAPPAPAGITRGVQDFGEPNAARLRQRLQSRTSQEPPLSIVQLGDSHTASDTLTGPWREQLQAAHGDAGIGWVAPMRVRGQSHQRVQWQDRHWQLTTSRTDESEHFPLGGLIATPTRRGATITLSSRIPDTAAYEATFWLRQTAPGASLRLEDASGRRQTLRVASPTQATWQPVRASVRLPLTLTATDDTRIALGGIWLARPASTGIVISPIGTNGARQTLWARWAPGWLAQLQTTQADLVILAYGTNEAFDEELDLALMQDALAQGIRDIRQTLPNAAVLVVGAPDALVSSRDASLSCEERRPAMLSAVQAAQRETAQREGTLYWDWRAALDGDCPMLTWQAQAWVGKDLVHFTREGYAESARRLHADVMTYLRP